MSQPRQLLNLQQVDSQLDHARARLVEIDTILNDNTTVKQAASKIKQAQDAHTKAQLALRRAEGDVQAQQDKIAKNQQALYSGAVKNPKELEDLQLESEALTRFLGVLEDHQLEVMLAFEEAEAALQKAQENQKQVRQQTIQQNSLLAGEQDNLLKSVSKQEAQRIQMAAGIEPNLLSMYEKLRQSRKGLAVAEVHDETCAACGATLSAAQAQAARSHSKITTCVSCGRIIIAS